MAQNDREREENTSRVFCDFRQRVARTRAEQRVRRAAAERQTGTGVFFWQLNQHEQNQQQSVQHHQNRQNTYDKSHINF
jgi:hypothetical protein